MSNKALISARLLKQAVKEGDCLIYPATKKGKYGVISVDNKQHYLHRVAYWLGSGYETMEQIPKGMHVAHMCKYFNCVNSSHYNLVTPSVNLHEHRIRDGTINYGEKHWRSCITLDIAQKIADSWLDKSKTKAERASDFGVTVGLIQKIDARTRWPQVVHPNGLPYIDDRKDVAIARKKAKERKITLEDHGAIKSALLARSCPQVGILDTSCRIWHKSLSKDVRPSMMIFGQQRLAARWACLTNCGRDEPELQARHLCGNHVCVNPEHLMWGTAHQNMADKRIHGTSGKKLDLQKVQYIRENKSDSNESLAAIFGVSSRHVDAIKRNYKWKM